MSKKVLLMILDGWGIATNKNVSAIDKAHTPFIDYALSKYPTSQLEASGTAVGLPPSQMGNSEVGHTNIGAGRVVYQDLVRVNNAIADGSLTQNQTLIAALDYAKAKNKKVHMIGLVSDGGIHSHIDHLKSLITIAHQHKTDQLFIHAFTDGRDTDPQSGIHFINDLQSHLDKTTGTIATVVGRYYAMDRDNRWERVKMAYDAMVNGRGVKSDDLSASIQESYDNGVTDEFIMPIIHADDGLIEKDDVVLCFNFRTDRGRQITQTLTQQNFPKYDMHNLPLYYITLTNYDDTFHSVKTLFEKDNLKNTLGEVLSNHGKRQIRIAETEKYPHVTFFFSGGKETPFEGERRLLCPSPQVATYDLMPEMSAKDITDKIIPELNSRSADFICLNFANPDMVGHTGDFRAAIQACETVDTCAQSVTNAALANDYSVLIIADHGNADYMINEDGSPNTAHTTNLVPCILIDRYDRIPLKDGKLGDLAPTILTLMGIDIPEDMTGEVLI